MSEFLEERFPILVRLGASYEDDYTVEITRTSGGKEYRKLVHPFPVRRFTVSFSQSKEDIFDDVLGLYHRAYGRYAGFLVRAIDDWSTNGMAGTPTALDQLLTRVDVGVYQLRKEYGLGVTGLATIGRPSRTIFKPVVGTVKVAVDGVAQVSGWAVDATTGRVTFDADPGESAIVTGGCEFDIPCRFDSAITITPQSPRWADTDSISLIELIDL